MFLLNSANHLSDHLQCLQPKIHNLHFHSPCKFEISFKLLITVVLQQLFGGLWFEPRDLACVCVCVHVWCVCVWCVCVVFECVVFVCVCGVCVEYVCAVCECVWCVRVWCV